MGSLRDIVPEPWPEGNERASEQIDRIVYGEGVSSQSKKAKSPPEEKAKPQG